MQNTQKNNLHIGISNSYGRQKHEFRQDSQGRQDYFLPPNNSTPFTHFSSRLFWVIPATEVAKPIFLTQDAERTEVRSQKSEGTRKSNSSRLEAQS